MRIHELNLKLRPATAQGRERLLEAAQGRFLRELLRAVEAAIVAGLPAGVSHVFIRQLDVRWALGRADLGSLEAARVLGRELGEAIAVDSVVIESPRQPIPTALAIAFTDTAVHDAIVIAGFADSDGNAWWCNDPDAVVDALVRRGATAVAAVLEQLGVAAIERLVVAAPVDVLTRLCTALPVVSWPMRVHATLRRRLGDDAPSPPTAREGVSERESAEAELPSARSLDDQGAPRRIESRREPEPQRQPVIATADPDAEPVATLTAATRWTLTHAGAVYLVRCALELRVGEHLWAAGFDERCVLAHVAALLLGPEVATPNLWVLGGVGAEPIPFEAERWATEEVRSKTLSALAGRGWSDALEPVEGWARPRVGGLPPEASDVVVTCASALLCALHQRLPKCDLPRTLQRFAIPGTLMREAADRLVVEIPMSAIDLDLRRAGLDVDPRHVPWMSADLRIRYTGGEEI